MPTVNDAQPKPAKQKLQPLPPPPWTFRQLRKSIHLLCFLIFVSLPFFDVMRFDIPRQRFYFAGNEIWINEFAIIFFSLMFLMFVVAAMAILYGRVYCGYLCPQMIFSEAASDFEAKLQKWINKRFIDWPQSRRKLVHRVATYGVLAVASVFLAFVFTSYFVEPRELLAKLLVLDIQTAAGITGAVVTLVTFLDFAFLRQTFCTTVCPYGYLQGMLVDKHSLVVHYREPGEQKACIECKKCVRVCGMGIDIRKSAHQLECVHCGECIDACVDVLHRIGKPGLIHYAWGEAGSVIGGAPEPWYRKIGLRDPKRFGVLAVLLFYLTGLSVALSMRHPVLVQLRAQRSETLYRIVGDGRIANRFQLKLANRGSEQATVTLRMEGLPGAELSLSQPVYLEAGSQAEVQFEVLATKAVAPQLVNKFLIISRADPAHTEERFALTFLTPPPDKAHK